MAADQPATANPTAALAQQVAGSLHRRQASVAVAESLTGGLLVQALARVEGSGEWLLGGVVAYAAAVKRRVLGVVAPKVVSAEAAEQMARGVRSLLGADVAVAVTGVAGPTPQDGEPPGTVWIGIDTEGGTTATLLTMAGSPAEVCERTVAVALERLAAALS